MVFNEQVPRPTDSLEFKLNLPDMFLSVEETHINMMNSHHISKEFYNFRYVVIYNFISGILVNLLT